MLMNLIEVRSAREMVAHSVINIITYVCQKQIPMLLGGKRRNGVEPPPDAETVGMLGKYGKLRGVHIITRAKARGTDRIISGSNKCIIMCQVVQS